jgi:hypothetical protein
VGTARVGEFLSRQHNENEIAAVITVVVVVSRPFRRQHYVISTARPEFDGG